MISPRQIGAAAFVVALTWSTVQPAQAQTEERRQIYDDSGRFVYVTYQKVPWARVDSLIQLNKYYVAHTEKGREMGCWLDREFLIHQTGSEYNLVFKTYREKITIPNSNPGCGGRAWRAAVPDSVERAQLNAGANWVFDGALEHRDEIYWEPYPAQ